MTRNQICTLGFAAIMVLGGMGNQSAFAQRGGWGGRSGFYGGYSPGYGLNFGYGNGNYGNRGGYGGYRGYGNGYGGYRGGYGGYGGYGNGGYYNQNYGQSYVQPSYIQPSYPSYATEATPDVQTAAPIYDGGEIVLFSAPESSGNVKYTLNGVPYDLQPGAVQRFKNDRTWTIEVALANGQAPQRYTLTTGRYKFKPMGSGIALVTTQDQPGTTQQSNYQAPSPNP